MPRQRFLNSISPSTQHLHPVPPGETQTAEANHRVVDELFSASYDELKRIARAAKQKDPHAALSPTTLVNEAWLKLAKSPGLAFESTLHFKLTAARAMRQTLVEAARRRDAQKRGGDGEIEFVTFDDFAQPVRCDKQLLALHESLNQLARLNQRQALLVESRYFGGMDVTETAALLGVSEATVLRDWRAAKAWLGSEIRRNT